MTHPTYHDALRAALTDLRLRLSTGWHPVATSGMHPYQDDAEMRQVQARVECGDDGVVVSYDDSGPRQRVDWWAITSRDAGTPGFPAAEAVAVADAYLAAAPVSD